MNKLIILAILSTSIILSGCVASDIHPSSIYNQQLKNIVLDINRVDRGAIHVTIKNNLDRTVVVNWEDSYINNHHIVKDMTTDLNKTIPDTEILPHKSINVTLYQKDNIFYKDPVLYQPGGYQTKEIEYPAVLKLLIDNVYNEKDIHFNGR